MYAALVLVRIRKWWREKLELAELREKNGPEWFRLYVRALNRGN